MIIKLKVMITQQDGMDRRKKWGKKIGAFIMKFGVLFKS